ncbi:hypothetical protein GCM10010269_26380 [Streptomyces humidus]|uniref:Uncharacterized protein n=2 Tax=Streptomyces humidus TaxID=52259 RepID=A0A918L2Q9_9ACTN|nr:hypothetical protein GCM10010269_26380 [Streptomyces humidus]
MTIEVEARMRLIDVEIDRYDWSTFECGCGKTAAHLADDLRLLAEAQSREGARALRIDDHALIQSFPQEPAVPVAAVLMAALSGDLAVGARVVCLDLLLRLVDTDDEDSAETCQSIARQGLWGLYRDLWSNTHPDLVIYAYLVLRVIETDEERLRTYRDSGRIQLPDHLAD